MKSKGGNSDQANPDSVKPITAAKAIKQPSAAKKNRRSGDGDIFAAPKGTALSSSLRPAKKAKISQVESS